LPAAVIDQRMARAVDCHLTQLDVEDAVIAATATTGAIY